MGSNKVAAILNPASNSGEASDVRKRILDLAPKSGVELFLTERRGHATEIARTLADKGYSRVIAVGGDGTLCEVANSLVQTDTALAAVPAGTGNDWVRSVGIPNDTSVAWHIATRGSIAMTDLAEIDGHGFCLNVLGAGFDAEVARRIAEARGILAKLGPKPRYVASVLSTIAGYKRPTLRLSIDGRETKVVPNALLVAVGVAKYYGSGMQILPNAVIDDGLLDVVWGANVSALELPGLLSQVYNGKHGDNRRVTMDRCKSIVLEADSPTSFHIDGDVRGVLPITVRIRPDALKIVVP